jgi:hypothetical protein
MIESLTKARQIKFRLVFVNAIAERIYAEKKRRLNLH